MVATETGRTRGLLVDGGEARFGRINARVALCLRALFCYWRKTRTLRVMAPNRCLQMINGLHGSLGSGDHGSCLMLYQVNSVCLVCILNICKMLSWMYGPDPASSSGFCSKREDINIL
jgi:hypothetical protein